MTSSSGRQAIQARKSCWWRKLRICCTRRQDRQLQSMYSLSLHDSVLLKRFDRATSLFDGLFHQLLAAGLFQRTGEYLFFHFDGNQQDAVDVTKDDVCRTHAHLPNLNGNTEVDDFAARGGILSV